MFLFRMEVVRIGLLPAKLNVCLNSYYCSRYYCVESSTSLQDLPLEKYIYVDAGGNTYHYFLCNR